jgi:hypothetical protein
MSEEAEMLEPSQVSIADASHAKLQALVADKYFAEMRDAYRFAVALALHRGAAPVKAEGPRQTLYSVSTLDPDGTLKLAIDTLFDRKGEAAFKIGERLAEWGIDELDRELRDEHLRLEDLLTDE